MLIFYVKCHSGSVLLVLIFVFVFSRRNVKLLFGWHSAYMSYPYLGHFPVSKQCVLTLGLFDTFLNFGFLIGIALIGIVLLSLITLQIQFTPGVGGFHSCPEWLDQPFERN